MEKIRKTLSQYKIAVQVYFIVTKLLRLPSFIREFVAFRKRSKKDGRFTVKFSDLFPCLLDRTPSTNFEPHYLFHPAWAARVVSQIAPQKHIDISSTLHFSTIVSAFVPVDFYDYRPVDLRLSGLNTLRGDLMKLPFEDNTVESISCLHTVEHVGLGRYGDPLDPDGDIRAAKELLRVTKPGGSLIFVTPVGKPLIAFNAHRIYSYQQVLDLFPDMTVREFSLVPDDYKKYGLIQNADPSMVQDQNWACGCFWFEKK
jgi:SAM-dependent methyltransferase